MKLTFDLDDVIFSMKSLPLYQEAFRRANQPYVKPTSSILRDCYDETVSKNLLELFGDDMLYTMPVLDKQIPYILNTLMGRPDMEILFVTERMKKQPEKTFRQLQNAGINCTFDQVYDKPGHKSDILKSIKPDIHFDDSPFVVSGCLEKNVPVVMISNNATLCNHHLRPVVENYKNLRSALRARGIYPTQKIK